MDTILCSDARPLIPAWADGELSEAQAAPLRGHLLECRECRAAMQDLRALGRWFQAPRELSEVAVPPGFAARVARRAFAGDTGERSGAPFAAAGIERERRRTLEFVLWLTSAAALILIALAVGLRLRDLPDGSRLQADDRTPLSTVQILERLQELNEPTPQPERARPGEVTDAPGGALQR